MKVSPVHPRIWLTAKTLTRLKAEAAAKQARWLKLKAYADDFLSKPPPPDKSAKAIYPAAAAALVYQVTGNANYARAAIDATVKTLPLIFTSRDGYHGMRAWGPKIAVIFDWCYDQMTSTQKNQIAKWLMDQADAVWPETNGGKQLWGGLQPVNNYFWGFMESWLFALAVYGDEPRAVTHLELARKHYRDLAVHFFNDLGKGGLFAEGTSYDSADHMGEILTAHLTATGVNVVADQSFATDSLYWRIHSTCPGGAFENIFGDQSRLRGAPIWDRDRKRALCVMPLVADSRVKAYAKWWLDHTIKLKQIKLQEFLVEEFIFYDPTIESRDYTQTLSTAFKAAGTGLCCKRSSWAEDALYFTAWSGPLWEAHQDRDCNGFTIWKNGWLVGQAKIWGESSRLGGTASETTGSNNITIGGQGQTYGLKQIGKGGKLIQWLNTPDYTIFVGQAAGPYARPNARPPKTFCQDYLRRLVFLHPNIFVIHDRVKPSAPSTIEWRLQSRKDPMINGRAFSWDNDKAKLFGQTLAPTEVTIKAVPVKAGPKGAVSSYQLEVTTPPVTAASFLTVLEVTGMGQSAPTPTKSIPGGVEVAGRRVIFSQTDDTVLVEKK